MNYQILGQPLTIHNIKTKQLKHIHGKKVGERSQMKQVSVCLLAENSESRTDRIPLGGGDPIIWSHNREGPFASMLSI